jgi:transcriptional regulator with AAA-type ATPase domain
MQQAHNGNLFMEDVVDLPKQMLIKQLAKHTP